jgi:zinc/manganese transport system permease protein
VAYDVLFASAEQAYGSLLVAVVSTIMWRYWSWWSKQGFYWAFALVCAFSVKMAGLLVVFVLLLAPALLFGVVQKIQWRQLLLTIVLVWLALLLSLWADWPAGYTLVAFLSGITLIIQSFRQ